MLTRYANKVSQNSRSESHPQLDVLPPQLTPFEALLFAANLRLPESVPQSEKLSRVYEVLSQLGLNDIANTRIGNSERRGISGGEMRRVSIGLELVGEPDVLILDEPTSGTTLPFRLFQAVQIQLTHISPQVWTPYLR